MTVFHRTSPLLAALLAGFCSTACFSDNPDDLVRSARAHLQQRDAASAEIELKNALQKNPSQAEGRYLLGLLSLQRADYPQAEAEFRRALELKYPPDEVVPKLGLALQKQAAFERMIKEIGPIQLTQPQAQADTQALIGNAHLALGHTAQAQAAFEQAARVPHHVGARIGFARLSAAAGKVDEARAQIEEIAAQAPTVPEAWEMKGLAHYAKGEVKEALAAWRKQIELEPDSAVARARLAGVLIQHNQLKDAASEVEFLKKNAPRLAQTPYLEALLAFREKRLPVARDAIGRLLKGAPDFVPGLYLAGLIEQSLNAPALAQKHLGRVLALDPNHVAARRALVRAYLQDNQPLRAREVLEPLLAQQGEDANIAALAGEVYLQTGDVPRAMNEFNRAATLKPNDTLLTTKVALGRMIQGRADEGFAELENLSQAHPEDHRPDVTLIAARLRARDFDKALAAIDALEKKMPGSALPWNLRGAAHLGRGDLPAARKAFEKALSIRPEDFGAAMNLAQIDLVTRAPQAAVGRFESVLAKDPKNLQVAMALADLRSRLGAPQEEVAALLGKAIGHHPQEPAPRVALVALFVRHQDFRQALRAAQEGLSALPDRPEMLDAAARAHEAAGEMNHAITLLQKYAALQPGNAYPVMRIARLQARNKDYESARVSLTRAIELAPRSIDARRELIGVELAQGRPERALEIARSLQNTQPPEPAKNVAGYVLEADIHALRRAWPQAVAAARAGLKVSPSPELAIRVHGGLFANGQSQEASRFASEWMKAHPEDVTLPLRLGDLAAARKDYLVAKKYYQQASNIDPTIGLFGNFRMCSSKVIEPFKNTEI
jgi:putative PEP-CTERM system TPR-repeat lipoprotein